MRLAFGALAIGLSVAACGGEGGELSTSPTSASASSDAVSDPAEAVSNVVDGPLGTPRNVGGTTSDDPSGAQLGESVSDPETAALSPLASQVAELPSALPEVALVGVGEPIGQQPRAINLPSLGVSNAPIEPVGLEDNGELEVPDADTVGWYEFGAGVDGGRGSTVLAAHIAYNGQNGVFQNLVDLEPGERFTIERDGEDLEYVVDSVVDYDKWELPISDLFSETSEERLILITCGGAFNPEIASYEDNTVVVAHPA